MFYCTTHKRTVAYHCEIGEHELQVHAVYWTSFHILCTNTHRQLVPWCPVAWIDDDADNGDVRSPNEKQHLSVDSNCYSVALSDEILKCPQAMVDDICTDDVMDRKCKFHFNFEILHTTYPDRAAAFCCCCCCWPCCSIANNGNGWNKGLDNTFWS